MASYTTLSPNQRAALHLLNRLESSGARSQSALATGREVNSVTDDPVRYFRSKALRDRASDVSTGQRNIDQGIKTLENALGTTDTVDNYLQQIKGRLENARSQSPTERKATLRAIDVLGRQIREVVKDSSYNGVNILDNGSLEVKYGSRTDSTFQTADRDFLSSQGRSSYESALFSFNAFSGGISSGDHNRIERDITSLLDPNRLAKGSPGAEDEVKLDAQRLLQHTVHVARSYYGLTSDAQAFDQDADTATDKAPKTAAEDVRALRRDDFDAGDKRSTYQVLRLARRFIAETDVGDIPDYRDSTELFGAKAAQEKGSEDASRTQATTFADGTKVDGFSGITTQEAKDKALALLDSYLGVLSRDKQALGRAVDYERSVLDGALSGAAGDKASVVGGSRAFFDALDSVDGRKTDSSATLADSTVRARVNRLDSQELLKLRDNISGLGSSDRTRDKQVGTALERLSVAKRGQEARSEYFSARGGLVTSASLDGPGAIENAIARIDTARERLRGHAQQLGTDASILQVRSQFTEKYTSLLTTGADRQVAADVTEEAALLAAARTRQQLSLQSLALAARQNRAILELFSNSR